MLPRALSPAACVCALALGACQSVGEESPQEPVELGPVVAGRIDYRELELLPTRARLEVSLTRSEDSEESVVSEWSAVEPGQVPIDFALPFDPESVRPEERYHVRARITRGDELLFFLTERQEVPLWEAVQEHARLAAELAAEADAAAALAEGAGAQSATPPELPTEVEVGRIVLTKTPRDESGAARIPARPLPEVAEISGFVETPGFEALPEGAELFVRLVQLSPTGQVEAVLSEVVSAPDATAPMPYLLRYTPSAVAPQAVHGVGATVQQDGEPLYRSPGFAPVDLAAHREALRAGSAAPAAAATLRLVRLRTPSEPPTVVDPAEDVIRGRIGFPGRAVLPEGAQLIVRLVPEGRRAPEDAPAEGFDPDGATPAIAEARVAAGGGFPVDFELPYEPEALVEGETYALRARVLQGEELLFLNTEQLVVEVPAAGGPVEAGTVWVRAVPRRVEPPPPVQADDEEPGVGLVSGRVLYLDRRPLPSNAQVEVLLIGTSRERLEDGELARQVITSPGQVPIDFLLEYDPAEVAGWEEFSVRARITSGTQLLYKSTRLTTVQLPAADADGEVPPVNAGNVLVTPTPR